MACKKFTNAPNRARKSKMYIEEASSLILQFYHIECKRALPTVKEDFKKPLTLLKVQGRGVNRLVPVRVHR